MTLVGYVVFVYYDHKTSHRHTYKATDRYSAAKQAADGCNLVDQYDEVTIEVVPVDMVSKWSLVRRLVPQLGQIDD